MVSYDMFRGMILKEFLENEMSDGVKYSIGCKGASGWWLFTNSLCWRRDVKSAEADRKAEIEARISKAGHGILGCMYPSIDALRESHPKASDTKIYAEYGKLKKKYQQKKESFYDALVRYGKAAREYEPMLTRRIIEVYSKEEGIGVIIEGHDSIGAWWDGDKSERGIR